MDGGGLLLASSTFATQQPSVTLFEGNQCRNFGGGLISQNPPGPDFRGAAHFRDNSARDGGGLYVQGGALTLAADSTLSGPRAPRAPLRPPIAPRLTRAPRRPTPQATGPPGTAAASTSRAPP